MIYLNKKKLSFGFTLIEIIIACAIISVSMIALMSTASKGIELSNRALQYTQANFLLEEGVEAVKTIRDTNWTTISNLTLNINYYLSFNNSSNIWLITTNPTSLIDSIFTRTIVFSAVYRDANDDIFSSGTLDVGTKKVNVIVSWMAGGQIISKNLTFYIANIFN